MKISVLVVTFFLLPVLTYAQNSCDSIKKENEYLRKALSLNAPVKEARNGDLSFSIVKVTGDIKAQAVTIEVLITNSGKNLESFGSQGEVNK